MRKHVMFFKLAMPTILPIKGDVWSFSYRSVCFENSSCFYSQSSSHFLAMESDLDEDGSGSATRPGGTSAILVMDSVQDQLAVDTLFSSFLLSSNLSAATLRSILRTKLHLSFPATLLMVTQPINFLAV